MKIKELLPLLPRYSDDSDYDVVINYISEIKFNNRGGKTEIIKHYDHILLHENIEIFSIRNVTFEKLLNCDVDKITSGRSLVNGGYDDTLQIWILTEEFAKVETEEEYEIRKQKMIEQGKQMHERMQQYRKRKNEIK